MPRLCCSSVNQARYDLIASSKTELIVTCGRFGSFSVLERVLALKSRPAPTGQIRSLQPFSPNLYRCSLRPNEMVSGAGNESNSNPISTGSACNASPEASDHTATTSQRGDALPFNVSHASGEHDRLPSDTANHSVDQHVDATLLRHQQDPQGTGHQPSESLHDTQNFVTDSIAVATPKPDAGSFPREWRSAWLKNYALAALTIQTILYVCVIIALTIMSAKNQGIITVDIAKEKSLFQIGEFEVGVGLSWTFVPVFILQIYILTLTAIVRAASFRQPYIELRSSNGCTGASTEKSISLDYRSYSAVYAPIRAARLKHFMLAYSLGLTLLANIILTGLAAYLFYQTTLSRDEYVKVKQPFEFDDLQSPTVSKLFPIYDRVIGTRVFDGELLPWTTLNQSILPFKLDQLPPDSNLTIPTESYAASLDCRILDPPYEFELAPTTTGWKFNLADRGCEMANAYFTAPTIAETYLETSTNSSCGIESGFARIVVISASNADPNVGFGTATALKNKTAVSCVPTYRRRHGVLGLLIEKSRSNGPEIITFTSNSESEDDTRLSFAHVFEMNLMYRTIVAQALELYATDFGAAIYAYAQKISPGSGIDGKVLRTATEKVFTSLFAAMASQVLVQPAPSRTIHGTLSRLETRVVVVRPVAYVIICILLALLVMVLWIWHYSRSHESILYEEPMGLLGMAAVLRNSKLMDQIEAIEAGPCSGRVAEKFIKEADEAVVEDRWMFDNWSHPEDARLCLISVSK